MCPHPGVATCPTNCWTASSVTTGGWFLLAVWQYHDLVARTRLWRNSWSWAKLETWKPGIFKWGRVMLGTLLLLGFDKNMVQSIEAFSSGQNVLCPLGKIAAGKWENYFFVEDALCLRALSCLKMERVLSLKPLPQGWKHTVVLLLLGCCSTLRRVQIIENSPRLRASK